MAWCMPQPPLKQLQPEDAQTLYSVSHEVVITASDTCGPDLARYALSCASRSLNARSAWYGRSPPEPSMTVTEQPQ